MLVAGPDRLWLHRLHDDLSLSLATFPDNEGGGWIAYTGDGLFCGDESSFDRPIFRVKDDLRSDSLIPVGALIDTHYREDLIEEFINGEPLGRPDE